MQVHSHNLRTARAHVIDVDMGYGHSRAAHNLKDLSRGEVVTANNYDGMPIAERELWRKWREGYETLSRLRPVPIIGKIAFQIVEHAQTIPDFYPRRNLSQPTLPLREAMHLIVKRGLGKHLVEALERRPLPAVCTHPIPAFSLETHGYKEPIWCVPTDADVARAWVALEPKNSRIRYLCANGRLIERLKRYGVSDDRLFLTGFPLPKELIGGIKQAVLKHDVSERLTRLDPQGVFFERYGKEVQRVFGKKKQLSSRPLTITYAVGGAGAQREIGKQILTSLERSLRRKEVRLILIAGTRRDVAEEYQRVAEHLGVHVPIVFSDNRATYFKRFNQALRETDILWTKPSELAFYTALGLPIIMAPPLGRQEEFNAIWLSYVGGGVHQEDPRYTNEWLFDWLNSGGLARAAWQGYVQAPTHGTYRIEDLVLGRESEWSPPPLIV